MKFDGVDENTCDHQVTLMFADALRKHINRNVRGWKRHCSNADIDFTEAPVLSAITMLWLESVAGTFGMAAFESAVQLSSDLRPSDPDVERTMRQAASDFLRRSEWLAKKAGAN